MTLFRRLLLLVSLAFWQGGFMFYGGVVVPVGASVLGSETEQGFITQSVTNYLNLAGAVCVTIWGATLAFDVRRSSRLGRLCWATWLGIAIGLGVLISLHLVMDRGLDSAGHAILDEAKFLRLHEAYITISTIQWLFCLTLLGLTLQAWRSSDRVSSDVGQAASLPPEHQSLGKKG
jgi:hypothetical protein